MNTKFFLFLLALLVGVVEFSTFYTPLGFFNTSEPQENLWNVLKNITWEYKFNKKENATLPFPIFSSEIKALEGKQIKIKGYVIPTSLYTDEEEEFFVISASPANSCFFCGGAGPETVMEIYPKNKKIIKNLYKTATLSGKLRLNTDDMAHLIYILEDATLLGP